MNYLKKHAEECGYRKELCDFLDVLEKNYDLDGIGTGPVYKAISQRLPEVAVVKIALANRGRLFSTGYSKTTLESGVKPEWEYTLEDWFARGEEEYKKHLDDNGMFKYSDFKIRGDEGVPSFEEIRRIRERARQRAVQRETEKKMDSEMNRINTEGRNWRIPPDERYYRFVKSFWVKFTKGEWNARGWYSAGRRLQVKRILDEEKKRAIQVGSYLSSYKVADVPWEIAERLIPKIDNGTLYSGWISNVDSPNNTIQIAIYERLQLPCPEITSISWHSGGFCPTSYSITISSRNRMFRYWIDSWFKDSPELDISFRLSPEQWEQSVLPAFQKCNFMAWADKDAYFDPNVFDGEQWHLTIRQGHKHVKDIFGSNDYPEEWDIFKQFVAACLELYKPGGDYGGFYGSILRYPLDIECSSFRETHMVSRSRLARMVGVRAKDIFEWENGTAKPDGLTLMKLYGAMDQIYYCARLDDEDEDDEDDDDE